MMDIDTELLQDDLDRYQAQLKSIKSYLKELNGMTDRHGTDSMHFEGDLLEAKHNEEYYENEIARIKAELRKTGKASPVRAGADTVLPQTLKQGAGLLIFSSIGFVAGVLLGIVLMAGRDNKDRSD
jgi:hypothetical protein